MALIGFLVLLAVGGFCILAAIFSAYGSVMFSGKVEWPAVLFYGVIGGAIYWFAFTHSPITISFARAA